MLLFHRLWVLQRQLTYGQERHASKKPWCAVAAMMPCVNCLSQEVHVLSAARQVLRINDTSILWIGLVHSTAYWQDHVAKCKGTLQCLLLTLLIDRELWFFIAVAPTWWQRRLAGQGFCAVCTWCAACIDKHKLRAVVSPQLTAPTVFGVLACACTHGSHCHVRKTSYLMQCLQNSHAAIIKALSNSAGCNPAGCLRA